MSWMLISDLHLTALPRDEYRWGVFDWIVRKAQRQGIRSIFFLGDLTEAKDNHPARLVNRLVDCLVEVYRGTGVLDITIIPGNHDGIDPSCPYFRFLRRFPFIKYIETPFMYEVDSVTLLLLPHSRDPETHWKQVDLHDADVIFTHVTVNGAVGENGSSLTGVHPRVFGPTRAKIYSGDVHVPQHIGKVEYVGAPYPIKFGDKFQPRCLVLERGKVKEEWHYETLHRHLVTIRNPKQLRNMTELMEGDQLKVHLRLDRNSYMNWAQYKQEIVEICEQRKLELFGISLVPPAKPTISSSGSSNALSKAFGKTRQQLLEEFCEENQVGQDTAVIGQQLVDALEEVAQ